MNAKNIILPCLFIFLFGCSEQKEEPTTENNSSKCKINAWPESKFLTPNTEVISFIEKETKELFFKQNTTASDFYNMFALLENMPGDRADFWRSKYEGFKSGKWFGADTYVKRGMVQSGDFDGYNWNGPIFMHDGLGVIIYNNGKMKFPNKIRIYTNLDKQFFSNDVFNAVREKLNLPKLKSCVYLGQGDIGGGGICSSGAPLLYKHKGRYFRLEIYVHGMKDKHQGTGKLDHTVINYNLEEFSSKVNEYKGCLKIESESSKLKL